MQEKKFEVEERYTKKRYLQYCRAAYWRGGWIVKAVWIAFLLFCAVAVIVGLVQGFRWGNILFFAVFFILGLFPLLFGYYLRYRRLLKTSGDFFVQRKIRFFSDRFESSTEESVKEAPYSKIQKLIETKDGYYLILEGNALLLVFKDCFTFGDPQELGPLLRKGMTK